MSSITQTKTGPEILEAISFQQIALRAGTVYQTVSKFSKGGNLLPAKKEAIIQAAIKIREEQINEYIQQIETLQSWARQLQ